MDKIKESTDNSHVWKVNIRAYRHIHSLNPKLFPITVIRSIFSIFLPYINLYMSAEIMNELAGERNIQKLTLLVMITIGLNLIVSALSSFLNKVYADTYNLYRENAEMFMADKTLSLGYADMENPDTHQMRREIDNAASMSSMSGNDGQGYCYGIQRPIEFLNRFTESVAELILSSLMISQLIAVLLSGGIKPVYIIFAVVIATCMAGSLLYNFYVDKLKSNQKMDFNKLHSYGQRINSGLYNYNMGKDIRLYRLEKIILKIKRDYMGYTVKANKDMEMFDFKTGVPSSIISRVLQICSYIFVCILAVGKIIGIGDVIKYVGVIQRFLGAVNDLFYPIGALKYNTPFIDNYFKFVDIPSETEKSGNEPVDLSNGYTIEFKNVSFKYPSSDTYALKNVSLKIQSGKSLAVVGMNGSGKTTFIKLLCRLYEIDEGEILLNGKNIDEYDYHEYINIFAILFQDFKLFSFSLGENISLRSTYDSDSARQCLEKVGFGDRYDKLEKGLETYIYKNFDENGIEVSGGEAQKIALARVLYKNSPFIILDEPTSALDPISEYEIYSKFNEISANKTAVFISHRLSSCRFCDDIAVFHEGEMIQRGSHDTLISDEGGKYHELWNAQAQYYEENKEK